MRPGRYLILLLLALAAPAFAAVPLPGVDWRTLSVDATGTALGTAGNPLNVSTVAGTGSGTVSAGNSSTTPLAGNGVFTGTGEDVTNYSVVTVTVTADVASAASGVSFQFSNNNTNWDVVEVLTYTGTILGSGLVYPLPVKARFFRIVYTNGGGAQAVFRLQTVYRTATVAPIAQLVFDATNAVWNPIRAASSLGSNFGGGTQPALILAGQSTSTTFNLISAPATGTAVANTGNPVQVAGTDGTNARAILLNTDGSLPAGGFTRMVAVTVVTSANTYSSGQAVGALNTLTSAVRLSGGSGVIQSVSVADKDKQAAALDVVFFKASVTAPTDHTTYNPGNTDLFNAIGHVSVTAGNYTSFSANAVATVTSIGLPFVLTSGTSLFAVIVDRGTPTYTGTSSLQLTVSILAD